MTGNSARVVRAVRAALALGCAAWGAEAAAQATCGQVNATTATCTPAGTQITITVERIVRLEVTPTDAALTAPTDADYAAGVTTTKTDLSLQTLEVKANVAWALTATALPWVAPYAKPIGEAEFSTNGGGVWTVFSGASQSLATGAATASTIVDMSYQVAWALVTDLPGVYSLPIQFTVSST